jgi:lipoic acid synthetase
MIMGDICTRRCPFCDVAHGKPNALDADEPVNLAEAIQEMQLGYVVVTSVDRDDLKDSGAGHFAACIDAIRQATPEVTLEVLVPDFRGRLEIALDRLSQSKPDVFNHNLETVPRLYKKARPGADYDWSLKLLQRYKEMNPEILTKSGLMLGLGETSEEIKQVLRDLRQHGVDMVTMGQYLQPSKDHLPVVDFVHPTEFDTLGAYAKELGFKAVASGPLVRSSYQADLQASRATG